MNISTRILRHYPISKFYKIKHSIFSLLPFITAAYAYFPLSSYNLGTRLSPAHLCFSSLESKYRQALLPNSLDFPPVENNICVNSPEKSRLITDTRTLQSIQPTTPTLDFVNLSKNMDSSNKLVYRADYKPINFNVDSLYFTFNLDTNLTTVEMEMKYNKKDDNPSDMFLNGEEVTLKEIKINGKQLQEGQDYEVKPDSLTIFAKSMPAGTEQATLYTKVEINPSANLKLSGLYSSGKMLCTQNEAVGFRRITYFFDRPDVMTKYTVKMTGNKTKFPVLLSNGNRIDHSEDGENHTTVFEDPFAKPCYLFALVAGQLMHISSSFKTMSGKEVKLQIFSEPENINKLDWAMESLKESMKWDEDIFGLEYDLNEFNIVAVNDFNMGAMENKGLNIFNTALVLAEPKMTSDRSYQRIKGVIAHEYFHNWTGNRVTCRDWFQLTLKEGLTVYRDQLFSSMVGNPATNLIDNVKLLRNVQYAEDSGPMSHPIRPDSYQAIENFYTATVYEKGAEVIRMYETYLGKEGFRKGMDLYFKRHDGQAVTCDDFRAAMADANNYDLTQFEEWYSQSGTPKVTVTSEKYDAQEQKYSITFKQTSAPQKNNKSPGPLMIPIKFALLGKNTCKHVMESKILNFNQTEQTFTFDNVEEPVIPSMFRGFSAPVIVEHEFSIDDTLFLSMHDDDAFTKWDSFSKLFHQEINEIRKQYQNGEEPNANPQFVDAFKEILTKTKDKALISYMISMPTINELVSTAEKMELDDFIKAREFLSKKITSEAQEQLKETYNNCMNYAEEKQNYNSRENEAIENRQLANTILTTYLTKLGTKEAEQYSYDHFKNAKCYTDKVSGLSALSKCTPFSGAYDKALDMFYDENKDTPLLVDAWFSLQAASDQPDTVERVEKLLKHKDFNMMNPNRLRSLIAAFTVNLKYFHTDSGKGYKILEDAIMEVDKFNSLMSAGLCKRFTSIKKMDENRQKLMKESLKNILAKDNLSQEASEIVTNCLN